ncbi:DUF4835 family protein [soil metagenome]
MHKIFVVLLLFISGFSQAQELRARVTVISNRVGNTVDKKVFTTLQNSLNTFMNSRKWGTDVFAPEEKIDCSFLLNLESTGDPNVYKSTLVVQAARPIFNSSYISPIINFQDESITFKYVEFQQPEFNDNRVTGTDALESNLTATLAYYAYMILGIDYDSFSPRGGDPYFQKAQNIVNNAPEGRSISGWKLFDGVRNRYWLVENLLNSRYTLMHDVYYNYYRNVLDKMYTDEDKARGELLSVLTTLNIFNNDNPNTMILQFYLQGKSQELIKILSKASPQEKQTASNLLQKLDVSNAARYKEGLR